MASRSWTCSYSPSTQHLEDFPLQSRKLGVSNATGVSPRARPSAAHACLAYSLRRGNIPTPAPAPRHAPHLRTTPCGAFPVELFAVGFSPNAGRVTDRYDKLSCRNSLGSRRIGDHEGLPPADGIRASGPGAHLRMRPLTRFERNRRSIELASLPSQTPFLEKKHRELGTQQPRDDIELTNISPMHVAQRFCIAPISKKSREPELHLARHWIETTDYSHSRAPPIQRDQHA